ncbi:MAG: hypothetical protein ACREF9_09685 [Opitutaceae bacterium]
MASTSETPVLEPANAPYVSTVVPSHDGSGGSQDAPSQVDAARCPSCAGEGAGAPRSYVYAIGRIEPRFPSVAVEKEFAQVTARADTKGKTDSETLQLVISARENRYLARQLCWVLTIQGLETYLLTPRDPVDLELLIEAVRPVPRPTDLDVVVGVRGPIAPPEMCNGLVIPIVLFDQIYSFDREALIKSIPRPETVAEDQFGAAAEELFDRIMQLTDNAGSTDENRALNYLAVRYPAIYARAAEQFAADASLSAVDVRPSPLSNARRVLDVIFAFTNRNSDVTEKFFVRVDVTEEFPFLITKMSPYYDR